MKIKVSSDSTCDLSPELVDRYGITIIPLEVIMDGKAMKDGVEITPQDIYDHVAAGGGLTSTTAVNVTEYTDFFRRLRKECDAVIHFTISSEMSACFQNALIAAEEVGNVFVIDSRNLSTGIGHLVLDAAILAGEGMDAAEIKRVIDEKRSGWTSASSWTTSTTSVSADAAPLWRRWGRTCSPSSPASRSRAARWACGKNTAAPSKSAC